MSFLGELGSINAVLKSATGLVREFKRPRVKSEDFARLLEAQVQQAASAKGAPGASRPETVGETASRLTGQFMQLRDADRNGTLDLAESGLDAAAFAGVDLDGDGQLNRAELEAVAAARIVSRYQQ